MNVMEKFRPQRLSLLRIFVALAVAIGADGLQLLLAAVGWVGPDQVIDCIAMGLTIWLLGFHVLLLPTFAVELIPLVDDFPTWTACVIAVIALRKRKEKLFTSPASQDSSLKPPIDV
jgi:hypothetical protein